jgi:hypothetical protein
VAAQGCRWSRAPGILTGPRPVSGAKAEMTVSDVRTSNATVCSRKAANGAASRVIWLATAVAPQRDRRRRSASAYCRLGA